MTIDQRPINTATVGRQITVCTLCGTRLRADDRESDDTSDDELVTIAMHRCAPRVTRRRQ